MVQGPQMVCETLRSGPRGLRKKKQHLSLHGWTQEVINLPWTPKRVENGLPTATTTEVSAVAVGRPFFILSDSPWGSAWEMDHQRGQRPDSPQPNVVHDNTSFCLRGLRASKGWGPQLYGDALDIQTIEIVPSWMQVFLMLIWRSLEGVMVRCTLTPQNIK